MQGTLIMPKNFVAVNNEEMEYLDGGTYLSKSTCAGVASSLALSPATMVAAATGAVVVSRVLGWVRSGGPLGWIVGVAGSFIAGAIGRVAYCIGYGATHKGCDIGVSPYPWDCFVSATVR